MSDKRVRLSGARMVEGQVHDFRILGRITACDGEGYFVVRDLWGYKILIPERHYREYGFKAGQTLKCRIDKVNCNGRMFLEPAHPFYREGQVYKFPLEKKGSDTNSKGIKEHYFIIRDILGKQHKVKPVSETLWRSSPVDVECQICRIKKGRLNLVIKTPHQ